jgi:hypothetical protein
MNVGAYDRPEGEGWQGPSRDSDPTAELAGELARRYEIRVGAQPSVADRLTALEVLGWTALVDRCWRGSRRAPVDAILIGAGGVVVLDVLGWRDVEVRGGGIYCGLECRDDDAARVRSLTDRVQDALAELGLTRRALWSVLLVARRRLDVHTQQVHLVGEENLATWVAARPARLEAGEVVAAATLLARAFPAYEAHPTLAGRLPGSRSGIPVDVEQLAAALHRTATAGPLDRWMTFLRPDQLALVTRSWDGPARITGAPGTGKTVVGLHRAAYLAGQSTGSVLYVAPSTALTTRLGGLGARLAPEACDRVVFTSLVDLAHAIVARTGEWFEVDERRSSIVFMSVWMSVHGGLLGGIDDRPAYWQEEIDHVIKARGITSFDEYAALDRIDRGVSLDREQRDAVWRLYTDYQRRLVRCRIHDVNDLLIAARDLVRGGLVRPSYSAVIADDAQDLPLVGLQLLAALAGDGPDRLLLLADGDQVGLSADQHVTFD